MQSSLINFADAGQVLVEIARFLAPGGIGSVVTWLLMRKKAEAEVGAVDAEATRTYAEARRLDSETINEAYDRIEELWNIGDAQREQIRGLTMQRDKQIVEIELLEDEVKWVKAVLVAAGVKLSDYDHLRRKRT